MKMKTSHFGFVKEADQIAAAGYDGIELHIKEIMSFDDIEYKNARKYIKDSGLASDFIGTPNDQAIVEMLCKMRELGGDVPKVAVMPNNSEDVLTLLSATNQYANAHADGPLITMSMEWLGGVSRVSGEIFGSALSFGSTVRASAPGQLSAKDLIDVLQVLQKPEEK